MAVELRQHHAKNIFDDSAEVCNFDEIIVDGEAIGMSFRFENKIHWTKYPKKAIPKAVIRQAVRLCQRRNENRE